MFKMFLTTGAALALSVTAAMAGNSLPTADNFQPFMWERPQIVGDPMTAHDLGMEDRADQPPVYEGRAVYIEDRNANRALARHPLRHHMPAK